MSEYFIIRREGILIYQGREQGSAANQLPTNQSQLYTATVVHQEGSTAEVRFLEKPHSSGGHVIGRTSHPIRIQGRNFNPPLGLTHTQRSDLALVVNELFGKTSGRDRAAGERENY